MWPILEGEDILDRRAAEFVDALVVVAHDADVAPTAGDDRGEEVLQVVCVLILVDKYVLEAALPIASDLFILLQELDREEEQVVKVHRAGSKHAALVFLIDLPDPNAA